MRQTLFATTSMLLVGIISIFLLGTHVLSVLTPSTHHSVEMDHLSSVPCVIVCSATTPGKQDIVDERSDDNDDKENDSFITFHGQPLTVAALEPLHYQQARTAIKFEPPPGSPAYIKLAVFRS